MKLLESVVLGPDGRAVFSNPPKLQNYIGGQYCDATDSTTLEIPDPLTGKTIFVIPRSKDQDCDQAIAHIYAKYKRSTDHVWTPEQRGVVFQKAGLLLYKYQNQLVALIRACMPKSYSEALGEIVLTRDFLMDLGEEKCRLLYGSIDGGPGKSYCTWSETRFTPWGAVGGIYPFNFPLEIEGLQETCALACGNAIVSKPHEYSGLVAIAWLEILLEAGMPKDLISIVHGYGPEVGRIATDERLAKVLFTGSSGVAKEINSPRLSAEQSGINCVFLFPQYTDEVSKVAESIAKSAFGMNGQRCSSARLVYAHQSWIKAGLLDNIKNWPNANLKYDDMSLPVLMSWSNQSAFSKMMEMHTDGINQNSGGKINPDFMYKRPESTLVNRFNYGHFAPSIFSVESTDALKDEAIIKHLRTERFFGNLTVIPWETEKDRQTIIEFTNSLPERLTCGIGTDNPNNARQLLEEIRPNGVTNVGPYPWTTGAEGYKMFGPVSPNGACIGGSIFHMRRMWMHPYGYHESFLKT